MTRFLTLEQYLERFVDEHTQTAGEDITLMVTEEQAQTLGYFFLNGIVGIVECVKLEGSVSTKIGDDDDYNTEDSDQVEFIN